MEVRNGKAYYRELIKQGKHKQAKRCFKLNDCLPTVLSTLQRNSHKSKATNVAAPIPEIPRYFSRV